MLSRETEQKLIELFITISIGEEKINKLKQNILSNFNINPIKFFFRLDINNSGYLSKNDISSYLKFFSVNFIPIDIDYIFYFYDKDNDNVLSFYEFLDLVISDSNYLYKKSFKKKFKHNKISQSELDGEMEMNAEKSIIEIFIEEIELSRQLNNIILNIKQNNDFSIQDIFYEIKSYSYITNDSLKAFFDRNEVNYNDKFIKNIFNRFDNKEINGKISFNKFKNFFDLPYNKNMNVNMNMNNQNIGSTIPQTINQTYISGDIKYNNSNGFGNIGYSTVSQFPSKNYNDIPNINLCKINNENYANEEDIQFECSHLSRSGSIESNKNKDINKNCKYVPKNCNRNNLYKNYLREKRSKSLEKSLSKSLSRTSEAISKTEKRNIFNKNINIRNIKPIYDYNDYNNSINDVNNMSNSGSSLHEDLPVKYPMRLDKNLVKRELPQRKNNGYNDQINKFNFCYDNHYEDLNMNNQIDNSFQNEQYYPEQNTILHHHHRHHCHQKTHSSGYFNNQNITNFGYEIDNSFNDYNDGRLYQPGKYEDDRFSSNNLDLKIYQEDISSHINNGRY
jgi:Ca2+-binding EF-hand superfamily protein